MDCKLRLSVRLISCRIDLEENETKEKYFIYRTFYISLAVKFEKARQQSFFTVLLENVCDGEISSYQYGWYFMDNRLLIFLHAQSHARLVICTLLLVEHIFPFDD